MIDFYLRSIRKFAENNSKYIQPEKTSCKVVFRKGQLTFFLDPASWQSNCDILLQSDGGMCIYKTEVNYNIFLMFK